MEYTIDCLFDFSVMITYHIHDWGTMGNRKMFVEDYCISKKISDEDSCKAINKYSKYYLKSGLSWFPTKEEVEEWYINYKNKKK